MVSVRTIAIVGGGIVLLGSGLVSGALSGLRDNDMGEGEAGRARIITDPIDPIGPNNTPREPEPVDTMPPVMRPPPDGRNPTLSDPPDGFQVIGRPDFVPPTAPRPEGRNPTLSDPPPGFTPPRPAPRPRPQPRSRPARSNLRSGSQQFEVMVSRGSQGRLGETAEINEVVGAIRENPDRSVAETAGDRNNRRSSAPVGTPVRTLRGESDEVRRFRQLEVDTRRRLVAEQTARNRASGGRAGTGVRIPTTNMGGETASQVSGLSSADRRQAALIREQERIREAGIGFDNRSVQNPNFGR